jgi:hypothetical protein
MRLDARAAAAPARPRSRDGPGRGREAASDDEVRVTIRSTRHGAFLILLLATSDASADAKGRWKREAEALRKELRHETVQAREDLQAAGPAPARGRGTELLDGSYYEHEDASVVFEKLGPVRVSRLRQRGNGRLKLVLSPPSDVRPSPHWGPSDGTGSVGAWDRAPATGLELGGELAVVLDVEQFGSVRAALASLVFLPGEQPSEAELAACLVRYPEQDERIARMRCEPVVDRRQR